MALRLTPEASAQWRELTEDIYGVPRGLIDKDPEAAAIIASLPPLRPVEDDA